VDVCHLLTPSRLAYFVGRSCADSAGTRQRTLRGKGQRLRQGHACCTLLKSVCPWYTEIGDAAAQCLG
jgi:hypothetical protein